MSRKDVSIVLLNEQTFFSDFKIILSIFLCSYDLMLQCWKINPLDRPNFDEIADIFENNLADENVRNREIVMK